jgi:hypothetical protein
MPPISARALASKLGASFKSLLIIVVVLIPVISFGEDLIVSSVNEGQNTRNSRIVFFLQNGRKSSAFSSGAQVSVAVTPQTATVVAGAQLQFSATVTNTEKTAVTWSASSGSISSGGLFTAPSQAGTVVVTATDFNGKVQASATVTVVLPLTISTSALGSAQVGTPYSASLNAQGGTQPYQWSLSSGSLPSGIKMSSTGAISGTPTQSGTFTFAANVTDTSSQSSAQQFSLITKAAASTPTSSTPSSQSSGNFDGPAELPRVYVKSTMADTPAPGNTITVAAGTSLQAALNNANCGDTLLLQAGATFVGNFTLPAKGCDDAHWIIVRSSAPDASLPPEGTRLTPCYAGLPSLPGRPAFNCSSAQNVTAKVMATAANGPFTITNGTSHYRLGPGLEITRTEGTGVNYGLIMGVQITADHIIIDRDWVHGTAQDDTTRGLMLTGVTYAAVVDSYFNDFHCAAVIGACVDSQAIAGGNNINPQGVYRIHNNFLEAAAETILFGGTRSNAVTPGDIEITNNHMFKPMIWMPGQPGFVGKPNTDTTKCTSTPGFCPFVVKNLLEFKNAQRILVEGNILEYSWPGFSQHGGSILVNGVNPAGAYSTVSVTDLTIRYNWASHTASGFAIANPSQAVGGGTGPSLPIARFSIHDDVFDDISPAYQNGDTTGAFASIFTHCDTSIGCVPSTDIAVNHITELITQTHNIFLVVGVAYGDLPIQNWSYTNSIVSVNPGVVVINAGSIGCTYQQVGNAARIAACFTPYTFSGNALIGGTGTWPSGNFFPADPTAVQFANYNGGDGGDYHLLSTSPYKNAAVDGKDLGADIDAVNQAIAGVL